MQAAEWPGSAWGGLRATRWDPPGGATENAERRRTYVFALEQAEQMFRAAESVGPAARPLLVFYGLSQAGRAIAAAAVKVEADDGWQLKGHGIRSAPNSLRGPLPDIEVCSEAAAVRVASSNCLRSLAHRYGIEHFLFRWVRYGIACQRIAWCRSTTKISRGACLYGSYLQTSSSNRTR